jgi:hypothetical protein
MRRYGHGEGHSQRHRSELVPVRSIRGPQPFLTLSLATVFDNESYWQGQIKGSRFLEQVAMINTVSFNCSS